MMNVYGLEQPASAHILDGAFVGGGARRLRPEHERHLLRWQRFRRVEHEHGRLDGARRLELDHQHHHRHAQPHLVVGWGRRRVRPGFVLK
jgi:hypothetical protein